MKRKLASIQKIVKISPIEGADLIELAHVLGWQCVVNKGQFKVGDLAVYFEIDSFLPIRDAFEFLRKSSYRTTDFMGEGFRLRTMKFRGEVSQGLLLPIDTFPEISDASEGDDVTEALGVRKWSIPEMATTGGTVIGQLPGDVPHTDEIRVQSAPELLQEFAGLPYYITTKMDGSSHSASIDAYGFHATGQNYEYRDDGKSPFYEFLKKRGVEKAMRYYMRVHGAKTLTVQGEYCGPGIQKNRLRLAAPEWYIFTVRVDGKRLGLDGMWAACQEMGLTMVPMEEHGEDLPSKYPTVEALLKRAEGDYPNGGRKEGIVIRPAEPVYSKECGPAITDVSASKESGVKPARKPILDPCCGSRMFYFDKEDPRVDFRDNRRLTKTLCDGRILFIEPDTIGDVTHIDAPDRSYHLVIFDPPHLDVGSGWQVDKYGRLPNDWRAWMKDAFDECFRILAENGTLVFKWYEYHISLAEVLKCTSMKPVVGNKRPKNSKTHWIVFFKEQGHVPPEPVAGPAN